MLKSISQIVQILWKQHWLNLHLQYCPSTHLWACAAITVLRMKMLILKVIQTTSLCRHGWNWLPLRGKGDEEWWTHVSSSPHCCLPTRCATVTLVFPGGAAKVAVETRNKLQRCTQMWRGTDSFHVTRSAVLLTERDVANMFVPLLPPSPTPTLHFLSRNVTLDPLML